MERSQFTFYRSYYEAIKALPKKDQTAVVLAICAYALDYEEPKLSGTASAIFALVRPTLDASRKKAESGKRGGEAKQTESKPEANAKQTAREKENKKEKEGEKEKENENECYTPKPPRAKFTPPTVEEVAAYCLERKNVIDAQHFVDYYQQQKWKLSNGNAMGDWKAAVRTWESRERKKKAKEEFETGNPFAEMLEERRGVF